MMDFNERVIPGVSANFLLKEAEARYIFCKRYVSKGEKILDFGCGCGYGTYLLSQKAFAIGIDASEEAINFAKKRYKGDLQFFVGDVDTLANFDNDSFGCVCSFEVIEHLDKPLSFVKEAKRILKNGSYFVLSTPNRLIHSPDGVIKSKYHLREYDSLEFERLLKSCFKNVLILGQNKSKRAKTAINKFMVSQTHRENIARSDLLKIRKLIPKNVKEYLWRYLGYFFGRGAQDILSSKDFPIGNLSDESEYLIAVCQK
ncbi:MAG: class I SAM-dependent methyltransferase [Patescibacteria group bacterium]|nr:class I SAM-dependent methyltransferase [Patescibacteria group bacterium]